MDPANVIEHDRFGGGSVMVWTGISNRSKTDMVTVRGNLNAVRYCNEIVRPVILPFFLRFPAGQRMPSRRASHDERIASQ